jgi:hypothetical protein
LTNHAIKKALTPKSKKEPGFEFADEENEGKRIEDLLAAKVDELEAALEEIEGYKA